MWEPHVGRHCHPLAAGVLLLLLNSRSEHFHHFLHHRLLPQGNLAVRFFGLLILWLWQFCRARSQSLGVSPGLETRFIPSLEAHCAFFLGWFCYSKYTFPLEAHVFFGAFGLEIKVSGISHSFYNRHSEKKILLSSSDHFRPINTYWKINMYPSVLLRKQLLRQQVFYSKAVVTWTRVCNSYAVFSTSYNALVQCGDVSTLQVIYLGLSFIEQQ